MMPTVKLEFTAYQGMCESSQAEGSLGQLVRAVNQTKLSGEYFLKKDTSKIFLLSIFPYCIPTALILSTAETFLAKEENSRPVDCSKCQSLATATYKHGCSSC